MSINNFKPFAIAAGSRVMTQATWETEDALIYGFPAGILTKERLNKAIRQPSMIAAAIAQYVVNRTGSDVLDDGDLSGLITKMTSAFGSGGGGSGADAQLLTLSATGFAFLFADASATTSPSPTITFTAYLQNVSGTVTFTAVAKNASGTTLGSITLGGTSPNATLTAAQFTTYANTRFVLVTATIPGAGGSTLTDYFTVYRGDGGSDALQARLTNEFQGLTSLADGTILSYSGATGTMQVYKGLVLLGAATTPSVTFALSGYTGFGTTYPAAQAGISINATTGDYAVTAGVTGNNATVEITATLSTGQTLKSTFSMSKTLKGNDGATGTAPLVAITAPQQAFITPANSTTPAPSSITVTATVANIPSPTYVWRLAGVVQAGATTSAFSVASFAAGSSKAVRCDVSGSDGSSAFDIMTIYSLKDGDNAVTVGMTNENQTISCDSTGTPKVGGGLPITSQIAAFLGATLITSGLTYAVASSPGFSGVSVNGTGAVSITGITANSATATFNVTYNGVTYQTVLTANKSLDGASGASITAQSNNGAVFLIGGSGTTSVPSSIVLSRLLPPSLVGGGTTTWSVITGTFTGSLAVINPTTGAFASFGPSSMTTNNVTFRCSYVEGGVTYTDDITIYKTRDGVGAYLTNDSISLTASNTGAITSYTGASGTFKLVNGDGDINTSLITFSVVQYSGFNTTYPAAQAGISINSGGIYSILAGVLDASAQATVSFQASYADPLGGTKTFVQIFTISKSLQGAPGTGSPGLRGSLTGFSTSVSPAIYSTSPWNGSTDDTNASTIIWQMLGNSGSPGSNAHLRIGDTVTLKNAGGTAAATKFWSGSAWLDPGTIISGNLLVGGTISGQTNINITGYARFEGNQASSVVGGDSVALLANSSFGSSYGGVFLSNSSGTGAGIVGIQSGSSVINSGITGLATVGYGVRGSVTGAGGTGVLGQGNSAANQVGVSGNSGTGAGSVGVKASGFGSNLALDVQGIAQFSGAISAPSSNLIVSTLQIQQAAATGTATWALPGTNSKPGANSSGLWVPINILGTPGRILFWPD